MKEQTNLETRKELLPSKDVICHSRGDVLCFCVHWFCVSYRPFSFVTSRMVSQIRSRLRDMNKLEQRHKFSPRAILARDHGSPGRSYTISPIFSSFSVSLCVGAPYYCGGSVILLPTGWFMGDCNPGWEGLPSEMDTF